MQCLADVTDPLSLGAVRIGPQRIVESTERMVSVLGLDGCGDPGRNPEVAMGIVLGVIVAVLVGLVSVIPFNVAIKKIRAVDPTKSLNLLGPFLLTIAASFVILVAGMVVCKLVAPDVALAYAVAELVAFVVGVIVFGVFLSKRR